MGRIYWVVFHDFSGQKMIIDLCEEEMQKITVLQLKEKICQQYTPSDGVEHRDLNLVFAGKRLDRDSMLLSEYGIRHKSIIQMVMSLDGGGSREAYEEYLKEHGKGDKSIDKKHMSMECLAYFKEDDLTHKEQKSVLSVKPPK